MNNETFLNVFLYTQQTLNTYNLTAKMDDLGGVLVMYLQIEPTNCFILEL